MAFHPFQRGDIIPFRFPYEDLNRDAPGPEPRPCLTVGSLEPGTICVAYGTKLDNTSNAGPDDLIVSAPTDIRVCKLRKATRFCLGRVRKFPIEARWIDNRKAGGLIGSLPPHLIKQLVQNMQRKAKRGHTIQHAAPVLALLMDKPGQRLACGATLELRPHCATVRLDDFSAEFWFDDELTLGEDLLELTRATPLLTGDEKAMALQVLVAKRVEAVMGSPFRPFNPPAA